MSIMMRLFVFILMPCRDLIVLRLLDRSTLTYRPVSLSFSKYSETARLGSYSLAVVPWWRQFPTHSASSTADCHRWWCLHSWSWRPQSRNSPHSLTTPQWEPEPGAGAVLVYRGAIICDHLWTSSKILSLLLIRLWTASHDGCWEWSNGMRK